MPPLLSFEKCTSLDRDSGQRQRGRVSFPMTTSFRMELEATYSATLLSKGKADGCMEGA